MHQFSKSPSAADELPLQSESHLENLLLKAGIRINGPDPWDLQLSESVTLENILSRGTLGLGETYMNGDWDVEKLDEFFFRVIRARLDREVKPVGLLLQLAKERIFNRQNLSRAWQVGEEHYDLGNDFYEAMLDNGLAYTCGYWKSATTLAEAQTAKYDLICRKLGLKPGMRILDIGCGWGGFMAYAAEHYDVSCVGVTVSKEQAKYAEDRYSHLPIEIRLEDYRALDERFDRIASVGMFEHVGKRNFRTYMEVANRCLDDHGMFLLHTIGKNVSAGVTDPWIEKYIFPNGELPSPGHICGASEDLFVIEDFHNFGADYDRTLMRWHRNFEKSWPRFADQLGERFYRQWRYYLLSCAGAFRARDLQLWQWTLSKTGVVGGCDPVR